eukprot:g44062.t1
MAWLVQLAKRVHVVKLDLLVTQAHQGTLVRRVHLVNPVLLDNQKHEKFDLFRRTRLASSEASESALDMRAFLWAFLAYQALRVWQEHEAWVIQAPLDLLAKLDLLVPRVIAVNLVQVEIQVALDFLDLQVSLVHLVNKVTEVPQDLQVKGAYQAHLGPLDV